MPQKQQQDQRMTCEQLTEWIQQEQQKRQEQQKQQEQQKMQPQAQQEESDTILLRKARSRALYILEASDKTEKQLREKLDKNYPPHITEQAIAFVKELHYIDDLRYARRYIEARSTVKSRRVICMELRAKGIPREMLEELEDVFSEETQEALVLKLAKQQLRKRKLDVTNVTGEELQKVYQFLMRRGFSYQEAQKAIRTLQDAENV